MPLLRDAVLLGAEADHRQQVFNLAEHALLDDFAKLFIARPRWVATMIARAGAQGKLDHFVAEVLGIGDAGRFFDLRQLLVQDLAIEDLAGIGVLVILILDPGIGVGDVAVEKVLTVFAVRFQIGLLDLMTDELGIACR